MRRLILLPCLAGLIGCASTRTEPTTARPVRPGIVAPQPSSAAALALAVPATLGEPPIDLARDLRQPEAYVAYEGPIVTGYFSQTIDDQRSYGRGRFGGFDNFSRRSVSTRFGVTVR